LIQGQNWEGGGEENFPCRCLTFFWCTCRSHIYKFSLLDAMYSTFLSILVKKNC
jgi:hypothetical protein